MKKIKNISKLLLVMLCLITVVGASERSDNETAVAREFRDKFCNNNESVAGCVYNPKVDVYTKAIAKEFGSKDDNILGKGEVAYLVRAYQSADANGNLVFAGCYRASGGFLFKVIEEKYVVHSLDICEKLVIMINKTYINSINSIFF